MKQAWGPVDVLQVTHVFFFGGGGGLEANTMCNVKKIVRIACNSMQMNFQPAAILIHVCGSCACPR